MMLAFCIWHFPPILLHPRNPPNLETQIPRYLAVQTRVEIWFKLNLYREISVFLIWWIFGEVAFWRGGVRKLKQRRRCETLQHSATYCNILKHVAIHSNTRRKLKKIGCCGALYYTLSHCNTFLHFATKWSILQHTATHCNTRRKLKQRRQCDEKNVNRV